MERYGNARDLDDVMEMLDQCIIEMHVRKLNIWDRNYPTREIILDDLNSGKAIVYEEDNKVVAFLVYYPMKTDKYYE